MDEDGPLELPRTADGKIDRALLAEKAWETLAEELGRAGSQARVRAANSIIDRVEGKAAQQINVTEDRTIQVLFASPALAAIPPADLTLDPADIVELPDEPEAA